MAQNEHDTGIGVLNQVQVGPLVQVKLRDEAEARIFPFSDLALEADDPGTISDTDLKARIERHLELLPGTLGDEYKVTRPATGNVLVSWQAVFGQDLTQEQGVVSLMSTSRSSEEWDKNCDRVKAANNGGYPSFWYKAIIQARLIEKCSFGGDSDNHICTVRLRR